MKTLKELVANGAEATFVRFKHQALIYQLEDGFEFPVLVGDISGEAELNPTEKAMSLMKWIRVQRDLIIQAKENNGV